MELLAFLPVLAALLLPGLIWQHALGGRERGVESWIEGCSLGVAILTVIGFWVAHVSVGWIPYALAACCVIGASIALRASDPPRAAAPRTGQEARALGFVLLAVGVSRYWVAGLGELPPGWDPAFHSLLASKVAQTDRVIGDWRPFAEISLNYPIGSHVVVATLAKMSGLAPHTAFRLLIPALGVLSTAQVYLFASRITKSTEHGLAAAIAYGFWAWWGSADYYYWGGLPNELGMLLLLSALSILVSEPRRVIDTISMSFLLGAVFVAHHHVLLVTGLILAVQLLLALRWAEERPTAKRLLVGCFGGAVLASIHVVPYALKITTVGGTRLLTFQEKIRSLAETVDGFGVAFVLFAVVGVLLSLRKSRPMPKRRTLLAILAMLFGVHLLVGHVLPYWSVTQGGEPITPFVPSRLLTDSAYFLSVFAGFALHEALRRLGRGAPTAIALGLMIGATNYPHWARMVESLERVPGPAYLEACAWIRANTDPRAVVLSQDRWTPYLTWRRTPHPPIPFAEPDPRQTDQWLRIQELSRRPLQADPWEGSVFAIARERPGQGLVRWQGQRGVLVYELPQGVGEPLEDASDDRP